jgi:hypothetical protein
MKPSLPFVLFIVALALFGALAYPQWREARKGRDEAAAIGTLRTIAAAQALHKSRSQDLEYAKSLERLGRVRLVDEEVASGTKNGYQFVVNTATAEIWNATADPLETGTRRFFVDQSGVITFTSSATDTPWCGSQ